MRYLWFLLLLLPLALSPFPYYLTLLNFFALSAMVALSLYVLTGLAGMTSFAQAAFMGMGAYATALLTVKAGLSPWLGLGAGLLSALLLALLLGRGAPPGRARRGAQGPGEAGACLPPPLPGQGGLHGAHRGP